MTPSSEILLLVMVVLTSAGAMAFQQYTATEAIIWLVLGLAAYNASNVVWIFLIGEAGLGKTTVPAAACQVIFLTAASALLGDAVGRWGWVAAGFACLAVGAALLKANQITQGVTPTSAPQVHSTISLTEPGAGATPRP